MPANFGIVRDVSGLSRCIATAMLLVLLLGLGMPRAYAGGHLEVCNKGSVNVRIAEIDWYGLWGENPEISGWYRLDVGECYDRRGLGVDVSLAFKSQKEDTPVYFYFDAPRIRNTNPFGDAYSYAGKVDTTSRVACVDIGHVFSRRTTQDQFAVCPAGWTKIQFNWHVVVCGELQNCSLSLSINPTLEQKRSMPDESAPGQTLLQPTLPSPLPSVPPPPSVTLQNGLFPPSTHVTRQPGGPWKMADGQDVRAELQGTVIPDTAWFRDTNQTRKEAAQNFLNDAVSKNAQDCGNGSTMRTIFGYNDAPYLYSISHVTIKKSVLASEETNDEGWDDVSLARLDLEHTTITDAGSCRIIQSTCLPQYGKCILERYLPNVGQERFIATDLFMIILRPNVDAAAALGHFKYLVSQSAE